jgi:hypothetical protein
MITKILFTLAVIALVTWFFSARRGAKPRLREVINPALIKQKKHMLQAALAFMGIMVIAAGIIVYHDISAPPAVVTVHVINTQSGEKISYRAIKDDIQGDSFTTLDGRRIYVAGVERLEVESH